MRSLVIGQGEVGQALYEVLRDHYITFIRDIQETEIKSVDIIHICFPDSINFVSHVKKYISQYKPIYTVIHSSVIPGTTLKCGPDVFYSPIRGRHTRILSKEIFKYEKFLAGNNSEGRNEVAGYFLKTGMKIRTWNDTTSLEFCKLISNIHLGLEIVWRQEVQDFLKTFNYSEPMYEQWEETYREGYMQSGDLNLIRPSVSPGPIGGHCILECTKLLQGLVNSKFLDLILETNKKVVDKMN